MNVLPPVLSRVSGGGPESEVRGKIAVEVLLGPGGGALLGLALLVETQIANPASHSPPIMSPSEWM